MNRYLFPIFKRKRLSIQSNQRWVSKNDPDLFLVTRGFIKGAWKVNNYRSGEAARELREADVFYTSSKSIESKYNFVEDIGIQVSDL